MNKILQEEQEKKKEYKQSKRPAFFRKDSEKPKNWKEEEYEAYKKLRKEDELDFDPAKATPEQLQEKFKVATGDKEQLEVMNQKMIESLTERLKERQLKFFTFLNKEFNILNYKSTNCQMHCFDDTNVPVNDVNECLSVCRVGIGEARKFAQDL